MNPKIRLHFGPQATDDRMARYLPGDLIIRSYNGGYQLALMLNCIAGEAQLIGLSDHCPFRTIEGALSVAEKMVALIPANSVVGTITHVFREIMLGFDEREFEVPPKCTQYTCMSVFHYGLTIKLPPGSPPLTAEQLRATALKQICSELNGDWDRVCSWLQDNCTEVSLQAVDEVPQ